ncbi:Hypothetical_protein [Hexamita inflata]|uniref:Hypothetical_protein n=1 Tax=Hexamita inflata TaxID=28002 RepID=A0AA86NMT4_9EUKA|nr:Hypothetical protein HINF_LOCUS10480 [Hexamita inflata]
MKLQELAGYMTIIYLRWLQLGAQDTKMTRQKLILASALLQQAYTNAENGNSKTILGWCVYCQNSIKCECQIFKIFNSRFPNICFEIKSGYVSANTFQLCLHHLLLVELTFSVQFSLYSGLFY